MPSLLRAAGVTRTFGSFTAVDDVSLTVEPGEVVGLLGANGAGKTTLIRMILGLLPPTSGELELFGDVPSREGRARLGYVPQGLGLWSSLTAIENLDFVDDSFGVGTSELPTELKPVADELVADMGLGHQRQLAFAAALGHGPELLVLDEPTSGVDPLSRSRLWDQIHDHADEGVGVLVTTHYMQEAQQCDRLVLMSRGRAVATGTEHDIIGDTVAYEVDSPDWQRTFDVLGSAGMLVTLAGTRVRVVDGSGRAVAAALEDAGLEHTVHEARATLEEAMTARER